MLRVVAIAGLAALAGCIEITPQQASSGSPVANLNAQTPSAQNETLAPIIPNVVANLTILNATRAGDLATYTVELNVTEITNIEWLNIGWRAWRAIDDNGDAAWISSANTDHHPDGWPEEMTLRSPGVVTGTLVFESHSPHASLQFVKTFGASPPLNPVPIVTASVSYE